MSYADRLNSFSQGMTEAAAHARNIKDSITQAPDLAGKIEAGATGIAGAAGGLAGIKMAMDAHKVTAFLAKKAATASGQAAQNGTPPAAGTPTSTTGEGAGSAGRASQAPSLDTIPEGAEGAGGAGRAAAGAGGDADDAAQAVSGWGARAAGAARTAATNIGQGASDAARAAGSTGEEAGQLAGQTAGRVAGKVASKVGIDTIGEDMELAAPESGPLAPAVAVIGALVSIGTAIAGAFHHAPAAVVTKAPPAPKVNIGENLSHIQGGNAGSSAIF